MRILVLGASGMLGNAMMRVLSEAPQNVVFGSARSSTVKKYFSPELAENITIGLDVENIDALARVMNQTHPDVVINCIGLVKQLAEADDPLYALPINAVLPHRLARLCALAGARLVHISTDCVFSGKKGNYAETDTPDAQDLYGRSKLLGEVDYPNAITLRTSIIGHELNSAHGLINWFLSQTSTVKGYTNAIFSGLPTCELARVIRDFVLPHHELHGLYQVSAEPISKYNLLNLVNDAYRKGLTITPDDHLKIDRSLNGTRFRNVTGYMAPPWPALVSMMKNFQLGI